MPSEMDAKGGPDLSLLALVCSTSETDSLWSVAVFAEYRRVQNRFVLHSYSFGPGGWIVSGGPKGWRIRKDNNAHVGEPGHHYHCYPGNEKDAAFAVKDTGHGSHDTASGTVLPKRLGEFLVDELNIPLKQQGGSFVVHMFPGFGSAIGDVPLEFEDLLSQLVEGLSGHWPNSERESGAGD